MKADARENGVEEATNAVPVSIGIIALAPAVGKTPFWARKMEFSHIVVIMNDVIWDQPIRGKGGAYDAVEWMDAAGRERDFVSVTLRVDDHNPSEFRAACDEIENKNGQPLRTLLRALRLWPKPAWNCVSPVKVLLGSIGIELESETPDGIIRELSSEH